jgi:hypothetical protein
MIDGTSKVQGECKPSLLEFAEPQPLLAVHLSSNALQRYEFYFWPPNFSAIIRELFLKC